jgi:mannose-6-phosphate isomerase
MNLYPLKFSPIYKNKIWGGNKIKTVLKKDYGNLPNCGESWELSGVPGNISVVSEGGLKGKSLKELIGIYSDKLLGKSIMHKYGEEFPLLVKFIDAREDLSIQVHPDDILASKRHNSAGKTEMWYIIHADSGSSLITGFNRDLDRATYLEYFNKGELDKILNREKAKKDDVFFIPAGRVHTIGKGLLLAEIQQSSDVTYRIFDFDRKDENGNKRDLHTELALDAIDYKFHGEYKTQYDKNAENEIRLLVNSDYFTTNRLFYNHSFSRDYKSADSFKILTCLGGTGSIVFENQRINISTGEVVLIPAFMKSINIETRGTLNLLETYIN